MAFISGKEYFLKVKMHYRCCKEHSLFKGVALLREDADVFKRMRTDYQQQQTPIRDGMVAL